MTPKNDEIIERLRRLREEHAEAFDYDPKRIAEDLAKQQRESARIVVTRKPRNAQPVDKPSSA